MSNQNPPASDAPAVSDHDVAAIAAQLGRVPRGLRAVAHRCPCGNPDVVETAPRLPDGTPFPTLYYLTCPKAASLIGTLEADGVMKEQTARLAEDPELADKYRAAHEDYIARRDAVEVLEGFPSAGGMPDRVKCLHVLVGHSLAAGEGVNPLGDEAIGMLEEWWAKGPCVSPAEVEAAGERVARNRAKAEDHAAVIAAKEALSAERAAARKAAEEAGEGDES
ncbi:DUF501 domain-containing protein [Kitasatospora cheerisanensis]|uniref:Ppx/GppA phosphatase n=1 Tax=Kitasatospora cheerisanensis KCTC 2395 TaxID=1348663 RepID=A0A066YPS3_9ACTN|nr:DUF501 domain-containing protein [Kitasatospora cheerisanensis]KDN83197.1 hypothetical protein KCH_46790 [Kitasatospora cheerisanensis KCTC 2395]